MAETTIERSVVHAALRRHRDRFRPGWEPPSQKLADRGWAVALVEKEYLGGTCINTGCTPTKTMIASAQVAY